MMSKDFAQAFVLRHCVRPFLAFPSGEGGCFGTKQTDEEKNVNFNLYVASLR